MVVKNVNIVASGKYIAMNVKHVSCLQNSVNVEEFEFEPMFEECEGKLAGKKVGIFGSYGWGDGEWMRNWEDRCKANSMNLVSDGVMCNESPDDEALEACAALGKALI